MPAYPKVEKSLTWLRQAQPDKAFSMALSQCHPELVEGCYLIPKRLRQTQPDKLLIRSLSQCHPELVEGHS
mgnify:CR=1 FL=1